jgi:hypothetical protein
MPYLGIWGHVGFSCSYYLGLKCCSHRECCVLKASCALIITFQTDCFCSSWANGNPWNRLGIVRGNPPLPQACYVLQYADRTTYWPNIPNLHFTSLLNILSTSLFHVRCFCSRMGGNRICKIVGKVIIYQYFSTSVPQHLDLLFVVHI